MSSFDPLISEPSRLASDQRRRWLAGERRPIEAYLQESPALANRPDAIQDLIYHEFRLREELGERPDSDEYCRRFPELSEDLRRLFEVHAAFQSSLGLGTMNVSTARPQHEPLASQTSPHEVDDNRLDTPRARSDETPLHRIGRYEIRRQIGQGGFGRVYLAYDRELDREVAVKAPRRERFRSDEDISLFVEEARAAAKLNHPAIVSVYDVGRMPDGACFVVMEYVPGQSLLDTMAAGRLAPRRVAEILESVARGLHHAHEQGLVHRDLKPGNILLDGAVGAHVADFGLAVNDRQRRERAGEIAGTPAYMSPEQVRGETHRLDGRTDLWSLGVVMYELLTGRRPFNGELLEVYDQILHREPVALGLCAPDAPPELERICHRCLSKRVTARYATCEELAGDLQEWLDANSTAPAVAVSNASGDLERPFVPKGLLAFSAEDADQFLAMLPGPRDRLGRPESLRFWCERIERFEAHESFAVGVLYGPTGSGKSSFVAAGLLPQLSDHVVAVRIECDAERTERRLLDRLRVACPALRPGQSLPDAVRALRDEAALPPGKKVLIVLDQFEQWLGRPQRLDQATLIDALRQCDGSQVQCLLVMRDDFWMPLTRLMRELDVALIQGGNCGAFDLLPASHAKRVLHGFGVALGRLPAPPQRALSASQESFLEQSIVALSEEGAVSPARLALFVEMMRERTWEPATLRSMGGLQGLGAKFLEETFTSTIATPLRRRHADAAATVLEALLPESAADLKGQPQSRATLLERSGYQLHPQDFDELMSLLRRELRLVTLSAAENTSGDQSTDGGPRYQLSHDFLVPSLRDWLSRRRRETAQGRAVIRLEELAQLWHAKPERRRLPSLWEWASIMRHVPRRHRNARQSQLMRAASRLHLARATAVLAVAAVCGWGAMELRTRQNLRTHLERLMAAETANAPAIIEELTSFGARSEQSLRRQLEMPDLTETQQRNIHLALLRSDAAEQSKLLLQLDTAEPHDAGAMAEVLVTANPDYLKKIVEHAISHDEQHFLACMPVLRRRAELSVRELMAMLKAVDNEDSRPRTFQWLVEENQSLQRRAMASIALAQLGQPQIADALIGSAPGSTLRSYVINLTAPLETSPKTFVERLLAEENVNRRRALLLLLGSFTKDVLAKELEAKHLAALIKHVRERATFDADCGVHAAANWALQQWGENAPAITPETAVEDLESDDPTWMISRSGIEMVVIAAETDFVKGIGPNMDADASYEEPVPESTRTEYPFAIALLEVTRQQYDQFRRLPPGKLAGSNARLPIDSLDWHDAAEYCNWLSEQEGIPRDQLCYRRIEMRNEQTPALLARDRRTYWFIEEPDWKLRTGYRLPTELERECACRANTIQIRFFGIADHLLRNYAWYAASSPVEGKAQSHPVGLLKPNDWGMFDTYGNIVEWCHERPNPDVETGTKVISGGSYGDFPFTIRSDNGDESPAEYQTSTTGFRVARTIRQTTLQDPAP